MFSLSCWTTSLRICIFTPTEVWEPPHVVAARRLLSHLLYRLADILHPSLTLSQTSLSSEFPGRSVWGRVYGYLLSRTKLINLYVYLSYQARTLNYVRFLILWDVSTLWGILSHDCTIWDFSYLLALYGTAEINLGPWVLCGQMTTLLSTWQLLPLLGLAFQEWIST